MIQALSIIPVIWCGFFLFVFVIAALLDWAAGR